MTTPARFDLILNDIAVFHYISEPALIEFIRLLTPLTGKIVLSLIGCLKVLSSAQLFIKIKPKNIKNPQLLSLWFRICRSVNSLQNKFSILRSQAFAACCANIPGSGVSCCNISYASSVIAHSSSFLFSQNNDSFPPTPSMFSLAKA